MLSLGLLGKLFFLFSSLLLTVPFSYLVNDNFFGHPNCWILVESSRLL